MELRDWDGDGGANGSWGEMARGNVGLGEGVEEEEGRFVDSFVGESKGCPVHACGLLAASVEEGLDGLGGVHVHGVHDGTGRIGTDRDHREIDGAMGLAEFLEGGAIGGIADVPDFGVGAFEEKTAPMREVAIKGGSGGKVLGGGCGDGQGFIPLVGAEPWDFSDVVETIFLEKGGESLGAEEGCVAADGVEGGEVEVVVVRVGDEDGINWGEVGDGERGWCDSFQVEPFGGAKEIRKNRVDQE